MNSLELSSKQCLPGELWYPGLHLDDEYTVPDDTELRYLWKNYTDKKVVHTTNQVYGVYSEPERVTAVASIDLCEVVRDTAVGLDQVTGSTLGRRSRYSEKTWFDKKLVGNDYEKSVVISAVRAIMDSGLIEPVKDISAIRAILQKWRAVGVYCVANTSTLPGCERGTITHTLQRDLLGCFDGLVLPRNHDGSGAVSKAAALSIVAEEAHIPLATLPLIHIDDAAHHILGFENCYQSQPRAKLFAPLHSDNQTIAAEYGCLSPLAAFQQADVHFQEHGVY
jgi:hypothetical protein